MLSILKLSLIHKNCNILVISLSLCCLHPSPVFAYDCGATATVQATLSRHLKAISQHWCFYCYSLDLGRVLLSQLVHCQSVICPGWRCMRGSSPKNLLGHMSHRQNMKFWWDWPTGNRKDTYPHPRINQKSSKFSSPQIMSDVQSFWLYPSPSAFLQYSYCS